MPQPIRHHLDEDIARAVRHGLRLHGIDVTTAREANLLGAGDDEQLAFAVGQQRVLLTCDVDFLVLASQGISHWGIVYAEKRRHGPGAIVRGVVSLAARSDADQMKDCVVYLSELLREPNVVPQPPPGT